jgi:hypothetical protein
MVFFCGLKMLKLEVTTCFLRGYNLFFPCRNFGPALSLVEKRSDFLFRTCNALYLYYLATTRVNYCMHRPSTSLKLPSPTAFNIMIVKLHCKICNSNVQLLAATVGINYQLSTVSTDNYSPTASLSLCHRHHK